jgi:hypothetical protein
LAGSVWKSRVLVNSNSEPPGPKPPGYRRDLPDLFDILERRDVDELAELIRGENVSRTTGKIIKSGIEAVVQKKVQDAAKMSGSDHPLPEEARKAIEMA